MTTLSPHHELTAGASAPAAAKLWRSLHTSVMRNESFTVWANKKQRKKQTHMRNGISELLDWVIIIAPECWYVNHCFASKVYNMSKASKKKSARIFCLLKSYLIWPDFAENLELGYLLLIKPSSSNNMVWLLDALSVVTQPICDIKTSAKFRKKLFIYLFCKPHSANDKKESFSQPIPRMVPRNMDKSNKVSPYGDFLLTTLQMSQLQPMSCNSHIRLLIRVRPQICGKRHLSKTVALNKS